MNVESNGILNLNNQNLSMGDLLGSGAVVQGSGSLTVASTGTTYSGLINGSGSLTKNGTGNLILSGNDAATGATTVNSGALTIDYPGVFGGVSMTVATGATAYLNGNISNAALITANGTVNFGANNTSGFLLRSIGGLIIGSNANSGNGQVNVPFAAPYSARTLLMTSGVTFAGVTNSWSGQLDLSNNDMIVHGGYLPTLENQILQGYKAGTWKGNGITSSAAAADTTHLTALGAILNADDSGVTLYGSGTALKLFDGYSPISSDVLIKYTYYGDTDLNGEVDGSDYARMDNGYLSQLTGWFNGDFNYDGVINGSDYTLMDNAFNTQGAALQSIIASPDAIATDQIAAIPTAGSTAVPEPASIALLGLASVGMLRRRRLLR